MATTIQHSKQQTTTSQSHLTMSHSISFKRRRRIDEINHDKVTMIEHPRRQYNQRVTINSHINDNDKMATTNHGRYHKKSNQAKLLLIVQKPLLLQVALCSLLLVCCTILPQVSSNTVVRPTIFISDSDQPNTPQKSQQPPQQQQQQQQQQQPSQSVQPHQTPASIHLADGQQAQQVAQSTGAPSGGPQQQQQHQPQAAPAASQLVAATKISPIKSKFCTSLAGQLRTDGPLGLQSSQLDDLSLSASSISNELVGPQMARLNRDLQGGAWCPMKPISVSNYGKEWLQVKLNRSFVVTAIETQGRFAMGSGKEYTPMYSVEYSRNGGLRWHKWKDFRGSTLLKGNDDTNSAVRNELSPPIVGANVIRIVPFSQHLRTVCLRLELFGCHYDEGAPISYATQDGVVEPRWGHLIDYTYDGARQRAGQLADGLGQLVDGVKGADNFALNSGFEWVGWKSMNGDVVLDFTFKTLRNFTGALFYSNNLFSSGVEVFQAVDVQYGIDVGLSMEALKDALFEQQRREPINSAYYKSSGVIGEQTTGQPLQQPQTLWSSEVLSIEYEPDKKSEMSRPVTVHLPQRLANRLRFTLKFASKWILVSEVEFISRPVELMSLASLNEQLSGQLMSSLLPAKSYDEYVAILRGNQLKRATTDAYLRGIDGSSVVSSSPSSAVQPANDQPTSEDEELAETATASGPPEVSGKRVSGPAIPPVMLGDPWKSTLDSLPVPSVISADQFPNPSLLPPPPPPPQQPPMQDPFANSILGKQNPTSFVDSTSTSTSNRQRTTVGLVTVISFALVLILLILAALFAISSYRLRHAPKTSLASTTTRFMSNVLVANSRDPRQQPHCHRHLQATANGMASNGSTDSHYNPLFAASATSARSSEGSLKKSGPMSTLKRLATLTTGGSSHRQPTNRLAFNTSHHQHHHQTPASNQLLVSLKDSIGSSGKGGPFAGHQSGINTQLIVGLNQANPMAQQQIYNSNNQTYATHYSTSMSMASGGSASTSNGNPNQFSADYAIPDNQPVSLFATNHQQMSGISSFQQGHNELRASSRAVQPPSSNVLHLAEHNYELIYGDQPQQIFPPQRSTQIQMLHNRTLSNQNNQNNNNCQQTFSSMTLNRHDPLMAARVRQQQQQQHQP